MSACRPFVGAWTHALLALLSCGPIAAQALFAELGKGAAAIANLTTGPLFVGDLDGDGDPDVLYLDVASASIQLGWNDGHGRFAAAAASQFPQGLHAEGEILAGDFDRDGDTDFVVPGANTAPAFVPTRFVRNQGGTFVDDTAAQVPIGRALGEHNAVADFDGDGDLDLFSCSWTRSELWTNRGAQGFAISAQTPVQLGYPITEVLGGDLDGDGIGDLITSLWWLPMQIWHGLGNGTFVETSAVAMPANLPAPISRMTLSDLDRDGDLDLLAGTLGINGSGHFGAMVLRNDGAGRFSMPAGSELPTVRSQGLEPLAGDFDGDGNLDLFVSYAFGSFVYRQEPTGAFSEMAALSRSFVWSACTADVDGDGDDDVIYSDETGGPHVLSLDSNGLLQSTARVRLVPPRAPNAYPYSGHHAFGDLDGDGAPEHVFALLEELAINGNDGDGWFRSRTDLPIPGWDVTVTDVEIVDFDGDGHRDVVLAKGMYSSDGYLPFLYLYRNDSTGRLVLPAVPIVEPRGIMREVQLAPADLDGDGDLDFAASIDGMLVVLEQRQPGRLEFRTDAWLRTALSARGPVLARDIDADGDVDLLVLDRRPAYPGQGPYTSRLLRNDGALGFTDVSSGLQSLDATQAALGDVDGDGDLDVVADRAGTLVLLRNTGAIQFVVEPIAGVPSVADVAMPKALADLDEDGDLDLALAGDAVYANDGTGTFARGALSAEAIERTGPLGDLRHPAEILFVDVDRDGDLDLYRTNDYPERVVVNLLRQIHVPYAPRVGRPFRVEVYARHGAASASDVAVLMLATASAAIPVPGIGVLRVDPNTAVALPPLSLPQPDGRVAVEFAVPNAAPLLGLEVHAQAVVLQQRAHLVLTNATVDVVDR